MKKCLVRNKFIEDEFIQLLGFNMLDGIKPVIFEDDGVICESIKYQGELSSDSYTILTKPIYNLSDLEKIEIELPSCTLLYDLKETIKIDRIFISSYYDDYVDYTLGAYELYLSGDLENLFTRDNKILSYSNEELYEPLPTRNHADQVFDLTDYKVRYFAIKITKSNATDDVIRLCNIGVYSHNISEQYLFCLKNFEDNVIFGKTPTVKGTYTADLNFITDGISFDDNRRVRLDTDTEYIFKLDQEVMVKSIYIVGSASAINNCTIYLSHDKEDIWNIENLIEVESVVVPTANDEISAATLNVLSQDTALFVGLQFKEGDEIDEIGVTKHSDIPENIIE